MATPAHLAAGQNHSLVLKADGTVWSWGNNEYKQLGYATSDNVDAVPKPVENLTDIVAIAAGSNYSLALKADGTVWGWGANGYGQLGNYTLAKPAKPTPITDLSEIVAIAAGHSRAVALAANGNVWHWGDTGPVRYGKLESAAPAIVPDLTEVVAISASFFHSLALKKDGTIWDWGWCYDRKVNNAFGYGVSSYTPVKIEDLTDVSAIVAAQDQSIALKQDGTVWIWGNIYYIDSDGNKQRNEPIIPTQVPNLTEVISISAAGSGHFLALKKDGTVWAWGDNESGQLGSGTYLDSDKPIQVKGLTKVVSIAVGHAFSLSLKEDGDVCGWGQNDNDQLGMGTRELNETLPNCGIINLGITSKTDSTTKPCQPSIFENHPANSHSLLPISLLNVTFLAMTLLDNLYTYYDIQTLTMHPKTGEIFAVSGEKTRYPGYLYKLDTKTGVISAVGSTGFTKIHSLTFHPDGKTLWGWADSEGLIRIHFKSGSSKLVLSSETAAKELTWNDTGTLLYIFQKDNLWIYNAKKKHLFASHRGSDKLSL